MVKEIAAKIIRVFNPKYETAEERENRKDREYEEMIERELKKKEDSKGDRLTIGLFDLGYETLHKDYYYVFIKEVDDDHYCVIEICKASPMQCQKYLIRKEKEYLICTDDESYKTFDKFTDTEERIINECLEG